MPNIQENITRIQGAKSSLKTSIENKGVTIPDDALIDTYYTYVDQIQTGSSSGGSSDYDSTMEDKHFTINNDNGWPNSMTSATIADGVTSLPNNAFMNSFIIEIEIPDSVTSLGDSCFQSCFFLSSITIPDSVISLGWGCFQSCSSLSSITIGTGVTSLSDYCFYGCSLSSIAIPDSVTSLGSSCFQSCSSLSSITIPDSITSLGGSCFSNCSGLTSIDIPDSVTSLSVGCFTSCDSLSSITIGTGVTSLSDSCFSNCQSLSSITIPSGVTSLGYYCFENCTGLTAITCLPTVPPTSGGGMFDSTNNCPIYVPNASVDTYKSAWTEYADRIHPISDKASLVLTYNSSDNTFPICTDTGISSIDYYMVDDDPTHYDINTANTQNIFGSFLARTHTFDSTGEHTIYFYLKGDRIEDLLFCLINQESLETVKINSSVREIGTDNFSNCSLTYAIIGENVEKIDNSCFQNNIGDFTLECLPTTPPTLINDYGNPLANCSTIYVPDASVEAYKSAAIWSTYDSKIQPLSSKPA